METRALVRAIVYDEQEAGLHYLLLHAKKGYWQNPQGGIDSGESELEAIARETREETGLEALEIIAESRSTMEYDAEKSGVPIHTLLAAYAIRVDSRQEVILSPEDGHIEYRWVSYDEALRLLTTYPEQKQVFEEVVRKIGRERRSS